MIYQVRILLSVVALGLLSAGCGVARKQVKPSVLILIDSVEQYDDSLGSYVAAENNYYRELPRVLSEAAGRSMVVDQGNLRIAAIDKFIDGLLSEKGAVSVTDLKQFLKQTDSELNALVAAQRVAEAESDAKARASSKALNDSRKELHDVKVKLLEIVRQRSTKEEIEWWVNFGKTVKEKRDELDKKGD